MTIQIGFLFALLVVMVFLFMTEKLPVELTAFIGLLVLVFVGFVEPENAFVGFSSPAVITMFSIFFISGALLRTGVADFVGKRLAFLSGGKEVPLIILLMLVAGVMSAFMNNVAAAAVLLPAVSSLSRHANISPSRLFMPLSFGHSGRYHHLGGYAAKYPHCGGHSQPGVGAVRSLRLHAHGISPFGGRYPLHDHHRTAIASRANRS